MQSAIFLIGGLAVLAIIFLFWFARKIKAAARGKMAEKGVKHAKEAAAIDERVHRADDAELDELLKRSER